MHPEQATQETLRHRVGTCGELVLGKLLIGVLVAELEELSRVLAEHSLRFSQVKGFGVVHKRCYLELLLGGLTVLLDERVNAIEESLHRAVREASPQWRPTPRVALAASTFIVRQGR